MQPYFFPYIGYFQLMHAADIFVMHDDVQYIKGGWINRNRICLNGLAAWLTLPVRSARSSMNINQRYYLLGDSVARAKRRLQGAYSKAPAYEETARIIFDLLDFIEPNVALFNANLLIALAKKFQLNCRFLMSSEFALPGDLKGERRVMELCKSLGADQYINSVGGVNLYHADSFAKENIQLGFLKTTVAPDNACGSTVHLSVIDMMMRAGVSGCISQLPKYDVVIQQ